MKNDESVLLRGSEVIGEAALRAGCRCYFGYPITPQNELPEYMARRMAEVEGATFLQSESELAGINMVFGASIAGTRVMTSSSSPGISLMQEGISYLAACELPAVIVNIIRGGPGLGNIAPAQSDYFQATRGGGHGDYRCIVLAPAYLQEAADLTYMAFDLADEYRTPVILLGDGMMGQMMEPVVLPPFRKELPAKEWALQGAGDGPSRFLRSLLLDVYVLEDHNWKLYRKYERIASKEVRFEEFETDDAELVVVAYGTAARIAKGAVKRLRSKGMRIGLFRPITLWPFPADRLRRVAEQAARFFVFEFSTGQMVEDVRLALEGKRKIDLYGRPGGVVITPVELSRIIARKYYGLQQEAKK
ncbi:MAG: 3-methyl-2-oxobutanoate dehydrogenase subunit VorB [bacterium]